MADNSKIEWTDHTFNGWIGCTKVSPACDFCYAERFGARQHVTWGKGERRQRTSASNWAKPVRYNADAKRDGIRYRVFASSLADVFDTEVPEEWRFDLFKLIDRCPDIDWLVLTKRSKPAMTRLTDPEWWHKAIGRVPEGLKLPQIWLGNTVENQEMMDMRWRWLKQTPAEVRFLSMEPLVGPVTLPDDFLALGTDAWVITGGESGGGSRPTDPRWFTSLRDQCVAAGVPHHFKQFGDWMPMYPFRARSDIGQWGPVTTVTGNMTSRHFIQLKDGKRLIGDLGDTFERRVLNDQEFMRVGKHTAGRMLEGRTWDELPRPDGRQGKLQTSLL